MRLFRSMDVSASGLTAERLRMDIIANNIANVNTTRTATGGPYRRQFPVFEARKARSFSSILAGAFGEGEIDGSSGQGVRVTRIQEDQTPPKLRYDPAHPDARPDGYVELPNVNVLTEMVDMISATRAYEANVAAINSAKAMAMRALEIGRG